MITTSFLMVILFSRLAPALAAAPDSYWLIKLMFSPAR